MQQLEFFFQHKGNKKIRSIIIFRNRLLISLTSVCKYQIPDQLTILKVETYKWTDKAKLYLYLNQKFLPLDKYA